ncbi:MAG: 16S rRNA (cytosine(1402)-N(4))-methyltransferase RsmH [Bacteroidetes bacterium]|nr:16S rRNA (cytosine(1402)-N(4))-methyltransferase RsmH [Bacteroidota bacterium]
MSYHIPVLLHECIDGLAIKPDGIYIDATFGGGGHSREIIKHLGPEGRLIGFDQDADAARNAIDDERFTLIRANFRHMRRFLRLEGITRVDGILADLGVSSFQFDEASRGFSYRFEGPLDMRMSQSDSLTAAEILNTYDADSLQEMFGEYGEVRNARTLAQAIVAHRAQSSFKTTADLRAICEQEGRGEIHRYMAQVYQALRMEVNDELGALKDVLTESKELLGEGGRLAVITFHSLEDRLVKNYMKHGTFDDEPVKDFFGNYEKPWKLITRKPVVASDEEAKVNSRSRSAKLRVAERIERR